MNKYLFKIKEVKMTDSTLVLTLFLMLAILSMLKK